MQIEKYPLVDVACCYSLACFAIAEGLMPLIEPHIIQSNSKKVRLANFFGIWGVGFGMLGLVCHLSEQLAVAEA
jgi:hypothetical protein